MGSQIRFTQNASPGTPPAGCGTVYLGSDGNLYLINPDGSYVKLNTVNASGELMIGTKAKLVPITNGFKVQLSTDGSTWQDGPSWTAS